MVQDDVSTVPKPGESEVTQSNVEVIPEVDVTYDDLEQSGENPENWLMYGNNYRRHHHTSAEAITPDNVSNLSREWTVDDLDYPNDTYGMQGSSIVVHGDPPIMYQTGGGQTVRAFNARTGELLWRYEYDPRCGFAPQDPPASRGTAVLGDTLYYSTLDFGMVALDRYTADEKWYYNGAYQYRNDTVADLKWDAWEDGNDPNTAMHPELAYQKDRGSSSAYPPLVHDGVVIKGSMGGEVGVAGWVEGIPTEDGPDGAAGDGNGTPADGNGTPAPNGNGTATDGNGTATDGNGTATPEGAGTPEADAFAQQETETATPEGTPQTATETPEAQEATPPEEEQTPAETETPEGTATPEGVGGEHNDPAWHTTLVPPDEWLGESWKHGGGTTWGAPALDPDSGMAVVGTANPGPWFGTVRPGWNRYTCGKVALDFQSGDVQWNYQESPHDWWDYDSPSPAFIYDAEVGGEERTLATWPGKTGWVFTADLETGELVQRSEEYVEHHNMWDQPPRSMEDAEWILPHLIGGTNPQPSSYDPGRRTMILKGSNQPMRMAWSPIEYEVGEDYVGMDTITGAAAQREQIEGWNESVGNVTALDPVTGEIQWQNWYETLAWGGTMTTSTGVSFAGVANGNFYAYDTESGDVLWEDEIGPGVDGNPISWVDPQENKQYVYVQAGGSRGGGGQTMACYSLDMG